jgi:hypothetical protein
MWPDNERVRAKFPHPTIQPYAPKVPFYSLSLSLSFFLSFSLSIPPLSLSSILTPRLSFLFNVFYSLYSFSAGLSFFSYFSVSLFSLSFWFCTTKVGARVPDVKRPFNVLLSIQFQSKLIRERDRTNIPFSFL